LERYGKILILPLIVQVESARQRLAKLAELQAAERAAGWEIIHVERPFEIEISGLVVRGKIDRIDRHAVTGEVRVLDYKTSDKPVAPVDAHLRSIRPGEDVPEWAQLEWAGRTRAWADLQLPLYRRALAAEFPGRVTCGYFNLPKASGETMLALWDDYTIELEEAAIRCAEGACAAIRRGEFWPPNESIRAERDECAALFHHGVEESVAAAPSILEAKTEVEGALLSGAAEKGAGRRESDPSLTGMTHREATSKSPS
jgi:ATP-dependent helicase/nuclease subunit B